MFRAGDVIYCEAASDDESVANAKAFIAGRGYTFEQVRIVRDKARDLIMVKWK